MKPYILDGGYEIVLANWPSFKRLVCTTHNNIPIEIPSHPYVLLNRTVLCNCIVEAESNFLLESIAVCNPEREREREMMLIWRCILWQTQHF